MFSHLKNKHSLCFAPHYKMMTYSNTPKEIQIQYDLLVSINCSNKGRRNSFKQMTGELAVLR